MQTTKLLPTANLRNYHSNIISYSKPKCKKKSLTFALLQFEQEGGSASRHANPLASKDADLHGQWRGHNYLRRR